MIARVILLINLFVLVIGCKEDPPQPILRFNEGKGVLAIGQTGLFFTPNDSIPIKIKLERVVSDSRCPEGANCIWAGLISAEIIVDDKNNFTTPSSVPQNNPLIYKNKIIKIIGATPYPKVNSTINQRDYKLEFSVDSI